jgi:hypothetical protein
VEVNRSRQGTLALDTNCQDQSDPDKKFTGKDKENRIATQGKKENEAGLIRLTEEERSSKGAPVAGGQRDGGDGESRSPTQGSTLNNSP